VAGIDFAAKLRRGLGQGKIIPREQVAKAMEPFDVDQDGSLTRVELATFLRKANVGGHWMCEWMSKSLFALCEQWYATEIAWIKIEVLARVVHEAMSARPKPAKRIRITPGGVAGYEELEWLDGSGKLGPDHPDYRVVPGREGSGVFPVSGTGGPGRPDGRGSSVAAGGGSTRPSSGVSGSAPRGGPPRPRGPLTPPGRPVPRGGPPPRRPGPGPRK
jgi:hypothetical protein